MTKFLTSFQRKIISKALRVLICLTLLRDCCAQISGPPSAGFMITGKTSSDNLGTSVSRAGDINNDGYDDIIIGAYYQNTGRGVAYVIYGGEESSFSDVDMSSITLDPLTTGFVMTGNAVGNYFGWSVSAAGDINNDGYDDIIIGAYGVSSLQGAAYVIYGGPKSSMLNWDFSTGATLDPSSTGFTITGNGAYDYFGYSVSTAGDINNDGYDDIIVGAYGKNSYQGAAYVIYGGEKSTMSNIALSSTTLNPLTTGFMITGNTAGDYFGRSVSRAGDINNDGYDDIIVGAFGVNSNQGAAYVIYGGVKSTMSNIALSSTILDPLSTGFVITDAAGDRLGYPVSTAGDINNDGYDDIIVGASFTNSNQGAAYVMYGGEKSTMTNIALSSTPLNPLATGFMMTGNAVGDRFGSSVSTAEDINNDGYDDIIIGAYGKSSFQGAAYVIYGGMKSSMSNWDFSSGATLTPSTTGFMITGAAASSNFGYSVSTAGDINNDGFDGIIIGAPGANSNKGAAYMIYAICSQNCNQCSSGSVCIMCESSYFMYQSECFASCPGATFASTTTTCSDCPDHCNQCSSTSVCTECQSSYLMYQSECFATCPDGTFANTPTTCEDCPTDCKHCSSDSVCTECKSSHLLYKSQCFASCPDKTLSTSSTTCEDCPNNCNHCTSTSLCTECLSPFVLYKSTCLPSCPNAMFIDNNECKDCPSYCSSCTSQNSCQVCYEGFILSNSLCVEPSSSFSVSATNSSSQEVQNKATQAMSSTTRGISSVISVGSTVAPITWLVSKTVQNTRYLNLSVTTNLQEIYQTWNTELISWDVPNVMSDLDHFEPSPYLFTRYDLDSPFLVNFWPTLLNIGIGFTIFIIFIVIQGLFQKAKYEGWAYSLLQKLVAGSFNFALVQAYSCLDDILFYLVLDAKTNPFNSFFSWTSMICAVLFLVLGCLLVFFNFWIVKKYQSIKKQGAKEIEAFNEKNKYWELFYSDFSDNDLWSQSFFATLVIRSTFSSFIITVLYDYPLMQTSFLLTLDGAILLFLYGKAPFNTLRGELAQYFFEIITLLVHICAFILSLQDRFQKSSDNVRRIFSTGIIYLNTILIGGSLGFMFIEIYKTISEKKREAKRKQAQKKPKDSQEVQSLTRTVSPFQPSETLKGESFPTQDQSISKGNLFLLPGVHQNSILAYSDFINVEPSQILESNFNVDNSRELEMHPTKRINPQRNQNTRSKMVRHKVRILNPRQQEN